MSPFVIPVVALMIPIVAILSRAVIGPWFALRQRQLEVASNTASEEAAQYAAHTERLEQRVRVLERIVTDRGMDLSGEIERLRSLPDAPTGAGPVRETGR